MRAVLLRGLRHVAVEQVSDPRIEDPSDAIVRITTTAVCGSDLHMYAGRTATTAPGQGLGHEPLGVVEETGPAVTAVQKGDRVLIPFNIACGVCFNCSRGFTSACLAVDSDAVGGAYGYAGLGNFRGAQAELLRVPYANRNCLAVPGQPHDAWEDDFVLLSDVFPTGWYANELAGVTAGSTVAVFGAGPVGLLSAYSASLMSASEIYVVDGVDDRLAKAAELGAIPIDFRKGDPVEQIFEARRRRADRVRIGDDKMPGVMCGIEAVGYQAIDWAQPGVENPARAIEDLIRLVNPTGRIGAVGLYVSNDPGGINPHAKRGEFRLSFGKLWEKGISLGMGQTPVVRFAPQLRDMIVAGRAKPSFIVSHRISLEEAPEAYAHFEHRSGGYIKALLKPALQAKPPP